MVIECPTCGKKGNIETEKIPEEGTKLTCNTCQGSFFITRERGAEPPQAIDAVQPSSKATQPMPRAAADEPSSADADKPHFTCSLCGQNHGRQDLVRFGEKLVCGSCKPAYVQMIQQGESHPAEMRYAGFWVRFAAKIIDSIVLWILLMPFSLLVSSKFQVDPNNPEQIATMMAGMGILYLFQIGIPAAFTCFFLGRFQATPGKMALGLIVTNPERQKISYLRALGRNFAELISSIILAIGYLMAGFDEEKRTLHDRICSTRVVYKR
jgi:uncharacterized RDD family membrane protein YckC